MTLSAAEQDALIGNRVLTADLDRNEVALGLQCLIDKYGLDWLVDESEAHPIRDLWKRTDFIAAQELFTLGDSIRLIEPLDSAWVRDAVSKSKSFVRNNRVGYIFEIIVIAAMIRSGHHHISPSAPNNYGYDVDASLEESATARISLKNFGANEKEREFERLAKAVSKKCQEKARRRGLPWYGFVAACSVYPSSTDWSELEQTASAISISSRQTTSKGNWQITPIGPPIPTAELASSIPSYSINIFAPHYRNEAANFMSSIADAALKLNVAAQDYDASIRPLVVVRLSENASLATYIEWAQEYVNRPDIRICGIFFIQSSIAQDLVEDSTSIVHTAAGVWRAGVPAPNLHMAILIGKMSTTPTRYVIIKDGVQTELKSHHAYTEANIYRVSPFDPSAGGSASLHQIPGYISHGGFSLGDGREMMLSPKQITPNKLTLYT